MGKRASNARTMKVFKVSPRVMKKKLPCSRANCSQCRQCTRCVQSFEGFGKLLLLAHEHMESTGCPKLIGLLLEILVHPDFKGGFIYFKARSDVI